VLDAFGEAGGTDQMQRRVPIETDAQQPIEAREMVHVGMGDESVAHAQELARGQDANISEVEEQRPTTEPEIDEEPRIRKRFVDQAGLHEEAQIFALLPLRRGPLVLRQVEDDTETLRNFIPIIRLKSCIE
jgi:hypothetical protein